MQPAHIEQFLLIDDSFCLISQAMLECVVGYWKLPSHMKSWDGDTFLRTAVILVHVRSIINPIRNLSPTIFHNLQ